VPKGRETSAAVSVFVQSVVVLLYTVETFRRRDRGFLVILVNVKFPITRVLLIKLK